ncbi:ABC transporter permease [uncultured Sphingomonas sp.]|uniref:ABC transporter permease n=1 Tax=uncultured Sphingomonas sp. TaxID=158754 RepID=UPI0025E2545D|nr:ABC transporter permease [uncultured Sphingomonas sp.]
MSATSATGGVSYRRLLALVRKETVQTLRDPSSLLIAGLMPLLMLFLFGYGLNLDTGVTRIAVVVEDPGAAAQDVVAALDGSPYLEVTYLGNRTGAAERLDRGEVSGFVVVPDGFSKAVARGRTGDVQAVTDGTDPNTAAFVSAYVSGAMAVWREQRNRGDGAVERGGLGSDPRYWFNPATISRNSLVPGSIAVVMTVVGALLTSLVVAREWERGTMEALLSTPITRVELLLTKIIPYFGLGMVSMAICLIISTLVLGVPFRGSLVLLFLATALFLGTALGLGLLLSTAIRSQFNAAQAALNAAFLPVMMLSGFVYEIGSMPRPVQVIASILPGRYFVTILQTLFQSDYAGRLYWLNAMALALIAAIFLTLTAIKTKRTLD